MRLGKIEPPERVYFFKRRNGSFFSCNAAEAFSTWKKMRAFQFEYIGTSSGQLFYDALMTEQARQSKLWNEATTDRKRTSLERKLETDTLGVLKSGMALELEQAYNDQTPPSNNSVQVEGQMVSGIANRLNRFIT